MSGLFFVINSQDYYSVPAFNARYRRDHFVQHRVLNKKIPVKPGSFIYKTLVLNYYDLGCSYGIFNKREGRFD